MLELLDANLKLECLRLFTTGTNELLSKVSNQRVFFLRKGAMYSVGVQLIGAAQPEVQLDAFYNPRLSSWQDVLDIVARITEAIS